MTVYADLVMILNFLVDFLLLLGTNRLAGFPPAPLRCALGGLVGGIYSGACLLPGMDFLGNLLWRAVSLGLMGMTAFGLDESSLKRCGVFVLLSMALGGVALSFGRGDLGTLLLAAVTVWLLCCAAFGGQVGGREYVPLTISVGERSVSLIALRDSGNTLRDPITGESVVVISPEAARRLTGLSFAQLAAPLETLASRAVPGLRLIPYRVVGSGGMLLGMRFEKVNIGGREQSALVAFAPEGLEGSYQALTAT